MTRPEYYSVTEQIVALANREVSAAELAEIAIARIEKFDAGVNAVVVRRFEEARNEAREADAALARGERKPLLGIPMTVKEAFNVAGLPTTWGVASQKDWKPSEDAVAVQRLRNAGAIIIGKTNVPHLLMDWQSYNDVYGTTNNPWDLSRTAGGSSGGSAASLAAGYVALELGSDIGGSLRVPAHFCGVFAHKPSYGLVPRRGHTPPGIPALPQNVDLSVAGPMARSASDLALALDILAGPDEPQSIAYRLTMPPPRHTSLKEVRLLILDTHPLVPTSKATLAALESLAKSLRKTGAKVERTTPFLPNLMLMSRIYLQLLNSMFGADIPIESYRRLQQAASSLDSDETPDQWRLRGTVLSHRDWIHADRIRAGLCANWRELFREFDAVVCPVMPTPAFPHDHSSEQRKRRIVIDGAEYPYLDQIHWPGIATLIGLPATALPIAQSPEGSPIGAQIIGPYLEDRTPIALAELIEREFGGFRAPPGCN
ncbi:MAG: amidase [Rhodomicrobium sp.]